MTRRSYESYRATQLRTGSGDSRVADVMNRCGTMAAESSAQLPQRVQITMAAHVSRRKSPGSWLCDV